MVVTFTSFSNYVFYPIKDSYHHFINIYLLSANAFIFVHCKICLFGRVEWVGIVRLKVIKTWNFS